MLDENALIEDNIFDNLPIYRYRILFWVVLVFIAAIFLQFLEEVIYVQTVFFTMLMILHLTLHSFSGSFKNNYAWFYFFLQCTIIFVSAFIMPHGAPAVLLGLLPILIAQSIHIFNHSLKVIFAVVLLYLPYSYAISVNYGIQELPFFIPILFFIMAIAVFYSILYVRQANAWRRMQYYLYELQMANQKIEDLTIVSERKRIARDLHDTLAQGLAGLIMRLEAIDIHLQNENTDRAKEIVQESMSQARETLQDAREAIDNLRSDSVTELNFVHDVEKEILKFTEAISIEVNRSFESLPPLSSLIKQHCIYVIGECLMNIAKHAQATNVSISICCKKAESIIIKIEDNGVGLNTSKIGKQVGHYGLIGLNERVRILNGEIDIKSEKGKGTRVFVKIPLTGSKKKDEK
ncbi:ATPase [Salipaludibacillus neizhouensis]|uniref:histidine kinase n=1 Tax=Salipaludibacillus neizhouensis TaxID=885475 RepID=A0A3A9K3D1_9BACI|nr:sensor histidine kinase [Salipaludibacillus neizhouensis]RKL64972.1 ATPase [Salipaludibacillus neizhouensis]